ncbi:4-azaleucine resistance probable transporter AzlC [Xenorhabdus koppenhoeferi]|uniref:4-azaleucine resistance probable transporter AzlC n=1 Tax=Xenorhabdus koppenhoeferi TaxID=351659 RepID=A0A1I7KFB8_9GAMM|nr:4-azaleucine resistance probable transporter AzlC [Xenorhabdus koppenhoeferi]
MQTPDRSVPDILISDTSIPESSLPYKASSFKEGIFDSFPIAIGYIPISFAFGLSTGKLGFTPLEARFFSCIIYAGASQFVITALLSAGMSLWASALTVMAMDIRHILYGPALRYRIKQTLSEKKTMIWAFGLTDEGFAAATMKLIKD